MKWPTGYFLIISLIFFGLGGCSSSVETQSSKGSSSDCDECPAALLERQPGPAPGEVKNSIYESWQGCPIGTCTLHHVTEPAGKTKVRRTLVQSDEKTIVLEVITEPFSKETREPLRSTTITVQRYVPAEFAIGHDQGQNTQINAAGKTFNVVLSKIKTIDGNGQTEEHRWESEGVPGLLVRSERTALDSQSQTVRSVTELVELKIPVLSK